MLRKILHNFFTNITQYSFCRFLMVGTVNTVVCFSVMFGLYNLAGTNYWTSTAVSYIVIGVIGFFMNKRFTFQIKGFSVSLAIRYTLNTLVCFFIAYGAARPLTHMLISGLSIAWRDNFSMLIGGMLFGVINYLGQKYFAFYPYPNKQKEAAKHYIEDAMTLPCPIRDTNSMDLTLMRKLSCPQQPKITHLPAGFSKGQDQDEALKYQNPDYYRI